MNPADEDRVLDLLAEWDVLRQQGQDVGPEQLCPDDQVLQSLLQERIARQIHFESFIGAAASAQTPDVKPASGLKQEEGTRNSHSRPDAPMPLPSVSGTASEVSSSNVLREAMIASPHITGHIGRYRIERQLGSGGFGVVLLAHDDELMRYVAVKVPHPELLKNPKQSEAYRREARSVAMLDHPHIVPVYDVGMTDEFPCFIVSKYIPGISLAARMQQSRLSISEAVSIVASIAHALHYAHTQRLIHCDVKPLNILLSIDAEPFLIDFGLAIRDFDAVHRRHRAGTAAYMSPEQVRFETHRLDCRTDIFSLGVVLYELIAGQRPFRGESRSELLDQIVSLDPPPPGDIDKHVSAELDRICLKAIAKRVSDRYSTADEFAADLSQLLPERQQVPGELSDLDSLRQPVQNDVDSAVIGRPMGSESGRIRSLTIVPKGLRSFDAHDSDFFLQLLPGPRGRDGLPESIRFWKTRIEERDAGKTFDVGFLYGPSGCGKSSLVKAGLLPRLALNVVSILIEATATTTESQMMNSIRQKFPQIDENQSLPEMLRGLRQAREEIYGEKVLIVIDQFEQWLHEKQSRTGPRPPLIEALRQCDGGRLQALILVRDDFWMATTRFARELETPLIEGFSMNAVERFPLSHAMHVLIEFGRAFGCIDRSSSSPAPEQSGFVQQAVDELAEDDQVVPMRLVVFAEMMKDKPWIPETLKQMGGIQGVGVTFLESIFSKTTANASHRYHEQAAQAVLSALLPDSGANIKGHLRTYDELLEASGYRQRVADFNDLIRILHRELRLITRTDPFGSLEAETAAAEGSHQQECFQLTHDYLVPSLREWLTRKQKSTRRGRAELQLADRTALWSSRTDNRFLPGLGEFLVIRLLTKSSRWTKTQRKMMALAGRRHAVRWAAFCMLLVLIGFGIHGVFYNRLEERVKSAVDNVFDCKSDVVPGALQALHQFPKDAVKTACLSHRLDDPDSETGLEPNLRKAYILAQVGDVDSDFLVSRILYTPKEEVGNLIVALGQSREKSLEKLRQRLQDEDVKTHIRLKSRMAIVAFSLGDAQPASMMCQIDPDLSLTADSPTPKIPSGNFYQQYPVQRSRFIEQLCDWSGDPIDLVPLASGLEDAGLRSAICMGLMGMTRRATSAAKTAWGPVLVKWWKTAPDGVTQSSAERALLTWGFEPSIEDSMRRPDDARDWSFNSVDMKMVVVPPRNAGTAMPRESSANRHASFLISDREVMFGQFNQFIEDLECPPTEKPTNALTNSNFPLAPVFKVDWYGAIMFCNWLSLKEGLTPCYERLADREKNEWRLRDASNGYRLPTEAQWEFACRAGTTTPYNYGYLPSSRWANDSEQMQRCASDFPNGWGLFDMHGNVAEWCHDSWNRSEDQVRISAVRGGNATMDKDTSQSDKHWEYVSDMTFPRIGFRVIRIP
jgi:serine/threonine protein kinase